MPRDSHPQPASTSPPASSKSAEPPAAQQWTPQYKAAGPGRWFVLNIRWPSGTCGCVRRSDDGRWRIEEDQQSLPYPTRDAAARAEQQLAAAATELTRAGTTSAAGAEQSQHGRRRSA